MGRVKDRIRLALARWLLGQARTLTDAVMAKHQRNVAKAMVRNAMLVSSGAVTTKREH